MTRVPESIYLDHHAMAPVSGVAREAVARALEVGFANPSSVHGPGRAARAILEAARREIAAAVKVEPAQVVLTSGGTEAANLGVLGLVSPARVVTTEVEHPAVAEAVAALEARGARVERLACPRGVPPSVDALEAALARGADLAAIQWVNHETGTLFPIEAYAAACRRHGVPLFVDAAQALGKVPVDLAALGASAVAIAASKVGGPAGSGALILARGLEIDPLLLGGSQERGRRAGTPMVAAHAGFAAALSELEARLRSMPRVAALRDRLEACLVAHGAGIEGDAAPRVATVTRASVPGWSGSALVAALDLEGLAASSGAACSSGVDAPSKVVLAMRPDEPWRAASGLRLSLGPSTTDEEVEAALAILERVLPRAASGAGGGPSRI